MADSKFSNKKFIVQGPAPKKIPQKPNSTEAPSNPSPPQVPYIDPSNYVDAIATHDIKPYLYFGAVIIGAWVILRIVNRS